MDALFWGFKEGMGDLSKTCNKMLHTDWEHLFLDSRLGPRALEHPEAVLLHSPWDHLGHIVHWREKMKTFAHSYLLQGGEKKKEKKRWGKKGRLSPRVKPIVGSRILLNIYTFHLSGQCGLNSSFAEQRWTQPLALISSHKNSKSAFLLLWVLGPLACLPV